MRKIKFNYNISDEDKTAINSYNKLKYDEQYNTNINISDELKTELRKQLYIDLRSEDDLILKSNIHVLKDVLNYLVDYPNHEFNLYYDLLLPKNSIISSYMVGKIIRFVRTEINKNSKNILYGDHKEKWGGIVGHIKTNRKDIAIRIINYVKSIRKKYPFISSSYTMNFEGFEIEPHKLKGLNNYKSFYKFKWQQYKRKKSNIIKRKKIEYKQEPRKKLIRKRVRLSHRDNLK